jgi:lipoprotein-anchoring transpeptidase ErfK/SrfK
MPVARPGLVNEREITMRLQIFLDQQNFGPGKIDGRPGEFTTKALKRYQISRALPATGVLDDSIPVDTVFPVYTLYKIKPEDLKFVGNVPRTPAEQAKLKFLPYTSLLEFIEERYHCSPEFLRQVNPGMKLDNLRPGDEVRVPNVAPFKIEELKEKGKLPENEAFKTRRVIIDTKERMLDVVEGEALLASFPITPGSSRLPAPKGKWKILGMATLPWFRHDEGVLNRGVRTSDFHNIPSGPNNPVGVVWIGINKPGIGIHGTNSPQTIGRSGSHGCIRTANWDGIRLSAMLTNGIEVEIK